MDSSSNILILLSLSIWTHVLITPSPTTAQLTDFTSSAEYCWSCSNAGNFTVNGTYHRNLKNLMLSISDDTNTNADENFLFRNASSGKSPDEVAAIGLCRGGLGAAVCQKCLNESAYMLLDQCSMRKEAILWGELCMVRYSNRSIFSVREDEPIRMLSSPNEAADDEQFKVVLKPLLDDLIDEACSVVLKYALGTAKVPNSEPIYALVQCTPDLTAEECAGCLTNASLAIPNCCAGKNGARILKPSCNIRYEAGPFYDSTGPQNNGVCTYTAEYCWNCFDVSNDSRIGIYRENLQNLLYSFSSSGGNDYGFYNSSFGEGSERVNAIALCRGDLSPETCRGCIQNSTERLLGRCPSRREATFWDERCMVRYSDNPIFHVRMDDPRMYIPGPNRAWEGNLFKITLKPLLDSLIRKSASGDSKRKYASGESTVPGYETIYATAQCTPDLDEKQCSGCLDEGVLYVPQQFDGKQGARILKPSCILRYEVSPFFAPTVDSPVSPKPLNRGNSKKTRTVIAVVIPIVVAALLLIISLCIFLKKKKRSKNLGPVDDMSYAESLQYDLKTIKEATNDFSDENMLGQGGFGAVYKDTLENGRLIAVKRLSKASGQGDQEFKNEVMLVARLQHRNLVRLMGFCLDETERLLVYEYVPNSSLDRFLLDPIKRAELDWNIRYKIIQGIVRGLLYLHEDSRFKIIHRDLKASNVLLDEEMNPKISDFGLARMFIIDQTQGKTNRIVGTYGYMAPEYVLHGQFSVKSDIFSFGVLLLEMVTGQKNTSFRDGDAGEDLLTSSWRNWREGTASNLIDPTISGGSTVDITRCIHIGLLCVQENVADRPTMNTVVLMFNSHSSSLAIPSKPAFFLHTNTAPNMLLANARAVDNSRSISAQGSANEISISEFDPR